MVKHLIPHLQRGFHFYLVLNQANGLNVRMIETLNHIKQGIDRSRRRGIERRGSAANRSEDKAM